MKNDLQYTTPKPHIMRTISTLGFILFALTAISACKSGEPSLERIVGTWNFSSFKTHPDSTMKETTGLSVVVFSSGGTVKYVGDRTFSGGWCNYAERYSLDGDILHLKFGQPNCIPLINPQVPETAEIVEYTGSTMIILWGGTWMKLVRKWP